MSLRRRLLLTLAPLFILGLIAVDAATYFSLQSYLVNRVDEQLRSVHPSIEMFLAGGGFGDGRGAPQPSVPSGTYGAIVSSSGAVLAEHTFEPMGIDATPHPVLPQPLNAGTDADPVFATAGGLGGVSRYELYVEVTPSNTGDILVAGIPLDDVTSTLSQLLLLELLTTAGITIVVLLATFLIVRRGLQPLQRMGDTARSIDAADGLSRRVEPATESSEVGRLGLAINAMLSQLESAFAERAASEQRLRHFVSDASHELRTPLTSMRGYAELLRRNPDMTETDVALATRRIEAEAERMGVLVDDLLLLARLDQGRPLERNTVDLAALVTDACDDARATDPVRAITARVGTPVLVVGDNMRLRQVLGNVVRNALVHTPPGTPIELALTAGGADAVIEVIDHGPGIPEENRERIFERFQRVDPGRSRDQGGSGLGLSIAAAVVGAHGGRIAVRQTEGGGATFRIELPLSATPMQAPEPPQPPRPDAVVTPAS